MLMREEELPAGRPATESRYMMRADFVSRSLRRRGTRPREFLGKVRPAREHKFFGRLPAVIKIFAEVRKFLMAGHAAASPVFLLMLLLLRMMFILAIEKGASVSCQLARARLRLGALVVCDVFVVLSGFRSLMRVISLRMA